MDNIRLVPGLRPAQQLTIMTRTVDHHGPRTIDIIRLPLSLRPAQLTIMGPASDSTIMGPALLWISGYRLVFAPHSWSKFKFIHSKLKFYSMFKIIRSKLAFLFVELAFFGKLLLVWEYFFGRGRLRNPTDDVDPPTTNTHNSIHTIKRPNPKI